MRIFIAIALLSGYLFSSGWDWITPWTWDWNLFGKSDLVSQVCRLTHNTQLPKSTQELLTEVTKKPALETTVQNYLRELQATPISQETMSKALTEAIQSSVDSLDIETARDLNKILSDLLEIKVGLRNQQFHTDSIMTLMFSEKDAPDGSKAFRFYKSQKNILPAFKQQEENAQAIAKQQGLGEHTRWMFGARTPGIGFLTHSGWTRVSVPNPEHSLWATRTLGLALGNKVAVGTVPLDFQALGPLNKKTAEGVLKYVESYTYNFDKNQKPPSTDMLHGLSESQKKDAQKITKEFVEDVHYKVEQLYKQVTHGR